MPPICASVPVEAAEAVRPGSIVLSPAVTVASGALHSNPCGQARMTSCLRDGC